MPLYLVECEEHGVQEVLCRSWRDRPLTCPDCGISAALVPTAATARFIGAGFHVVDYPKEGRHETETVAPAAKG